MPLIPRGTPGAGVVVGDPAYKEHKRCLKNTREEVDRITELFGHEFVKNVTGIDASIGTVLRFAELPVKLSCSQGFLHFAVHGQGGDDGKSIERLKKGAHELAHPRVKTWPPIPKLQPSAPTGTGLHPTEDSRSMEDDCSDSVEDEALAGNPQAALSTHLAPAPAERTEISFGEVGGLLKGRRGVSKQSMKDGILSSEDIMNSGFEWRARVAVLSACDTYRGQVFSEGVLNLSRALIAVGVPCAVVSQWTVEDASAPDFMYSFHSYLRGGKDVASALRSSMLEMLNKEEELYKWGLFVVYGLPTVKLPREFRAEMHPVQGEVDE